MQKTVFRKAKGRRLACASLCQILRTQGHKTQTIRLEHPPKERIFAPKSKDRMIKYLSILFACMVLALSTMPCFLMDKCLFSNDETACDCQSGDEDCADCCSPFMHCSTCPGCTRPETAVFCTRVVPVVTHVSCLYVEGTPRPFYASIWQPPRA